MHSQPLADCGRPQLPAAHWTVWDAHDERMSCTVSSNIWGSLATQLLTPMAEDAGTLLSQQLLLHT
jgi:hypothetical protein